MTRKHYVMIAAEMLRQRPSDYATPYETVEAWSRGARDLWHTTVLGLASVLSSDGGYDLNGNRRFKRDRFIAACGADQVS